MIILNILIVGDIFSKLGRAAFERNIKRLQIEKKINFIIVNGENISHGKGMNEKHYKWLMSFGVNVVTLGNHSFHNKEIYNYIDEAKNIVRPANYPDDVPGKGFVTINYNGLKITVIQVIGQVFMEEGNTCPFKKTEEILESISSDIYICDIHAEATSEKVAFGHYFDGKIDIIFGTHTHVPTNDARILKKGSAYITDVGMTGPLDGVIGVKKEIILNRIINEEKARFEPEDNGESQFNAILVEMGLDHKVKKIEKINIIE